MDLSLSTVLALICVLVVLSYLQTRPDRHRRNIKKSKRILRKIRSFQGDGLEGRIFTYLRKIDPYVFEELILTCFREQGFKIIRNKKYSGDGGIDGVLYDDFGRRILLQSKRYQGNIKPEHIREFIGVIKHERADYGYFIHTGRTSRNIFSMLKSEPVYVFSGSSLVELVLRDSRTVTKNELGPVEEVRN
jgi:restriction system protein